MTTVSFIGLGTMGYPMAGHLARSGLPVTVFNRTRSKAERWCTEFGGVPADSPAAAAEAADIIITCVGNDDDLRSVVLGDAGIRQRIRAGALLVDHSTVSAAVSREIADRLEADGASFIDAPVSGGQQGALNGQLTIMCGGQDLDIERARSVITHYARAITHMGPVGNGQLTKMVNQICVAGVVQGLAEGMHFAEMAQLDLQKVMDAISQGAASSWQMVNRHKTMIAGEYEHGFAVDWMRKDLSICLAEARQSGATLPVTALVDQMYADIQATGGGKWDTSSLLHRLQHGRHK
ncbi:MAG: NAD(P)-dependent oxidoreductase, partial [Gammaproteobacteria bacterium]